MARIKTNVQILSVVTLLVFLCSESGAKTPDNRTNNPESPEIRTMQKNEGPALMFADDFKQTIERYLFGICPQTFKMNVGKKNSTTPACDLDVEQQDLAGRFATLALRAHSASRSDCSRLGIALANTLGELARTAASRHTLAAAANETKKRKLSKSQKKQIQAKQRTALAVKKKAAAVAAAAAAKMAS